MADDDRARRELHVRLEEVLGEDAAATLVESLPPVGWVDRVEPRLAQVDDRLTAIDAGLVALGDELDSRFDLHADVMWESLLEIEVELGESLRAHVATVVFVLAGAVFTMSVLAFVLGRLSA